MFSCDLNLSFIIPCIIHRYEFVKISKVNLLGYQRPMTMPIGKPPDNPPKSPSRSLSMTNCILQFKNNSSNNSSSHPPTTKRSPTVQPHAATGSTARGSSAIWERTVDEKSLCTIDITNSSKSAVQVRTISNDRIQVAGVIVVVTATFLVLRTQTLYGQSSVGVVMAAGIVEAVRMRVRVRVGAVSPETTERERRSGQEQRRYA